MSLIKVMHIIGGGEFGGAEQHILTIINNLDKNKFDVKLCCLSPEPLIELAKKEGISVFFIPMKSKIDIKAIFDFAKLLKKLDVDIVHTHGVRANFIGRLGAKLAHVPVIFTTVHSILKYDYPRFITRIVNSFLEYATTGLTNHYIAVSSAIKENLIRSRIKPENISIIHNSIDTNVFKPGKSSALRQMVDIKKDDKLIGVIARLHPVKGIKYFVDAANMILQNKNEYKFVIVGDGPCKDEIKKQIKNLGIDNEVFMVGFLDNIPEIIQSLDLLVVPSLSEGFGLTAIEALATKVPVVATKVGGLKDIICPDETGILVPPGNSQALAEGILNLLQNKERTNDFVAKGHLRVKQLFSIERMAKSTEEIYIAKVEKLI